MDVDKIFQKYNIKTPGCAVSIIKDDKTIIEKCIGLADLKTKSLITPNTAFRLASLTKPFTAMAIMLLSENSKLNFEDKLSKYFPNFPAFGKEITVRQLLTHTSGMPDHEKPLYKKISNGYEPTIYDSYDVLKRINKPLFKPGSDYGYSDAGYVILALLIEKISGLRYSDFLNKNIFIPLKMNNTIVMDDKKPEVKNRAYGYRKIKSNYELFDYDPLNYVVGDEGIYSSLRDLTKWIKAWYTGILVRNITLIDALEAQKLPGQKQGKCGFSWFITSVNGEKVIYHDGFWVGFNNIMLTFVNKQLTIIMLSNTTDFPSEKSRINTALNIAQLIN